MLKMLKVLKSFYDRKIAGVYSKEFKIREGIKDSESLGSASLSIITPRRYFWGLW